MFSESRYISWAIARYGKVAFDLATSGAPLAPWRAMDAASSLDAVESYAALPAAIARYNDLPSSEVVPALGTSQALFYAYAALLSPGDEVLVETPGYEPLTRAAEGLGALVRTFERRGEDGFRVVPDRVAAAMTPRTRAIVVTDHHNPSGAKLSREEVVELARIAEAQGAVVVVDEVYAPLHELPVSGVFATSARKLADNVVAVGSLTKCYGLGLHRVGWLLGPGAVVERARHAAVATVGHLPLSHASLAVAAFGEVPRLAARAAALVSGKRELAARWVSEHASAKWSAPPSGLFGLVTLPGRSDLRASIEACAASQGVLVAPGEFFGAPESFRISWATCDADRFEQALAILSAHVMTS